MHGTYNGLIRFLILISEGIPDKSIIKALPYLFSVYFVQIVFITNLICTCTFRYVQLPADEVDTQLLQDATRKEAAQNKQ